MLPIYHTIILSYYHTIILFSIVPCFCGPQASPRVFVLRFRPVFICPDIYTPGGAPGDISAGLVSATALSAAGGRQSEDGETGGGVEGDATLYAALLQLTMQAGGPHGVMDASEIKRAIDRRS